MDGGAERRPGDIGQRLGDARDRPDAADIGERDQQRRFRFHAAKNAHQVGCRGRRCGGILRFGEQRGERAVRIGARANAQSARGRLAPVPKGKAPLRRCRRESARAAAAGAISAVSVLPRPLPLRLASHAATRADDRAEDAGSLRSDPPPRAGEDWEGKPPDQGRLIALPLRPLSRRRPRHHTPAAPAGPTRGRAMVLRKPG